MAESPGISRRGLLALGGGAAAAVAAAASVRGLLWETLRWKEDFFPGEPPDHVLQPHAWVEADDRITFAVLGDNGSGGRNAMNVARAMADEYERSPYGLVLLAGDISYYGSIDDRWDDVFVRPYRPLIDAGVDWDLAIGNHELEEKRSEDAAAEIEAQLRHFGKPGTYYRASHGPMDVFVLDSSTPSATGDKFEDQLSWLDQELVRSDAPWKVALFHHPPFSSGKRGSNLKVRAAVQDRFADGGIDVVFNGHDHHYERTHPQGGVTYFVSGGGCKLSKVGHSDFTAYASSILQFLHVEIRGDEMEVRCIRDTGQVADQVVIRRRGAS